MHQLLLVKNSFYKTFNFEIILNMILEAVEKERKKHSFFVITIEKKWRDLFLLMPYLRTEKNMYKQVFRSSEDMLRQSLKQRVTK